jgi:hypothetical protein
LAKYLIGQAPSYASFIALGCGPKPLLASESQGDYSDLNNLEFEVLRVPISSRGYVYDDAGNANIVFSAELPTEQRYEFTEIGVFSAKSNPVVGSSGSRMIYTFSESENWEYHDEVAAGSIITYAQPLYLEGSENTIAVPEIAFRATSNNALFVGSPNRIDRHERPRFLDKALLIRGDMSKIDDVAGSMQLDSSLPENTRHIHYTGTLATPDLTKNSPSDELRLAFSVVNKADDQVMAIDSVRIILEFANTDGVSPDNFARISVNLDSSTTDFTTNRYFVISSRLEDLQKSTGFSWSNVNLVKAYVSVYEDPEDPALPVALSENYYVALDGLLFENTTASSPLYGMSGYSVLRNDQGLPVIKESNSANLVEFRFGLDVQ